MAEPTSTGTNMDLGNLSRLSQVQTRSLSAENPGGDRGQGGMATEGYASACARDLGQGWKVSPAVRIEPGATYTLAEIEGPGAIQSLWMGGGMAARFPRWSILRIYWDGQAQPSVECPLGDFFAAGWEPHAQLTSLAVCVNPNRALNCCWEMPFRRSCRITVENLHRETTDLYYQVNYVLGDVPADAAYFHAQFRRVNPLPYKSVYTLLDGVRGQGHFVGTYMAWGVHNNGWWGEGEVKFYVDGDGEFPTICGTGLEDYFCGSYAWTVDNRYVTYTTPYAGVHQVIEPDGVFQSQQRFAMYRWHIMDPVRFQQDLRVTVQALGWRADGRYLPLQDDIASVAYWYQSLPTAPFPPLPDRDGLEII